MKNSVLAKLIEFINKNHQIVKEYLQDAYKVNTCTQDSPYGKFRNCFLDAMVAAGGPVPFDKKKEATEEFEKKFKSLFNNGKPCFEDFCNKFPSEEGSNNSKGLILNLFNELDTLPQIGQKKAAMVIRNVVLYSNNDIFNKLNSVKLEKSLILPIDTVVKGLLSRIFGELKKDLSGIPGEDDMKLIEVECENAFPLIWLDDLWFWGHFSMRERIKDGQSYLKNCKRYPYELNEARLLTDMLIDGNREKEVRKATNLFVSIIKDI